MSFVKVSFSVKIVLPTLQVTRDTANITNYVEYYRSTAGETSFNNIGTRKEFSRKV